MKKEFCPVCNRPVKYDKRFRAYCSDKACDWKDTRARTMLAVRIDKREAEPSAWDNVVLL